MRLNKLAVRLCVATLLTLSSSQVMASKFWTDCNNNTPRKWPGSGFTFNANPAGFGGNYTFWRTSFATALGRFNDTPVNLTINVRLDDDTSVAVGNGESEIWWDNSGNSAVGYNITSPCGTTIEGDIVFHNTVSYDDSMENKSNFWNYGGNNRTFETTALHEVGHTVGLAHENRYYNIMGSDYTHVHTTGENALRSYLGEDAVNGLISLYGGSNREDLSVAAWRHIGSSGEYSTHGRTRLFNSNGTELNSSNASTSCTGSYCELRYNVDLGQTIQYEMTLENNGRNSQSVALGYYISTNATITNTDTLIRTDNVTVTRNTPDTVIKTITIPSNLTPNTDYYLGVLIDSNDTVSEWTEQNNTSYMHIRTGSASQNQAPTAEANGPYNGSINSPIGFSSSGSNDSDGSIASYNWNFGDGSSSNSATPSHSYSTAGSYTAVLTVTDNLGASSIDSATVTITGNSGGTLENACATEGPTSAQNLTSGDAICVPNTSSTNYPQYYYIYVNAGTNSITIESDHGTGNADVYYKASNWATASSYDQRSSNAGNTESITVANPGTGWQYISIIGARTGMTLKVTLN
ncbi:PKD domain-containing protein [Shewanella sp. 10N.286.45.A1]|uniref:PKD domain-containing protein n=1 Tax=Shewanella sp. 10N.286.45.A1 TaxID=3229694 RepID=UPI0035537854